LGVKIPPLLSPLFTPITLFNLLKFKTMKKSVLTFLAMLSVISFFAQNEISKDEVNKMIDQSAQYQKELVKMSAPMVNFLLKYDKGSPTQADFDEMLNQMGIMDEIQNDNSGLTKEDAFKFINAYIKADQGEEVKIDQDKKDKVLEYLNQLEQGKKDAEQIFNQVITEDKVNEFLKQAQAEVSKLQTSGFIMSYDDFKKEVKKKKPDATDAEIQKAYKELRKQLGL